MKISVVIPNYNGEKYIEGCLNSLKKQSFYEFEIIIVDNFSKDMGVKLIKEKFSELTLIENKENLGFSAAVNIGIKASNSEFVVLLNNDTEVDKDYLLRLYEKIIKDDKIFSVSSKMIRYFDREKIDDAGDFYNLLGWAFKRGDGASVEQYNKDTLVFSACAGAAIYRKSVFDEIGYFDEKFFAYLEDMDIAFRGKIFGYINTYCADSLVYHMVSASSGSRHNDFKVKLAARNNLYMLFKNLPIIMFIINLPFIFLGALVKYLFFRKKGFVRPYMDGIKEAIKNRKTLTKTKYKNKNLFNYIKIELELILNLFRMFYFKLAERK